ncbi:MAG: hypothetical protein RLZZ433_536 [Pseudomonadota bacterium]|jgi:hypothetical protein
MNVQERDQLLKFLATLRQTPVRAKDPLADSIIRDALGQNPDAIYALVQRGMALQITLDAALAQIKEQQSKPETIEDPTKPSTWQTGLLAQVSTLAVGTTVGVVAGGLLLDGILPDTFDL